MRYLFFDIECANCFNGQGKICSFGYVITDTQFNILEQKDILINPKQKFHLCNNKDSDEGIELGYPLEMFTSSPDFEYYYETIRNLLTYKEQIVFGHSVLNDIHFILSECSRYNKEPFAFTAYDSQVYYMLLHNESLPSGLAKICESYGVDTTDLHRSDFDAYLTMQVINCLCHEFKTSFDGLHELYPNASYTVSNDGKITNNFVSKSNTKKLFDYARHIATPKLAPETLVAGKHFCFCKEFEENHFKKALYIVRELRLRGGYFCTKASRCEYYLKTIDKSESDSRIQNLIDSGHNIKTLSLSQMLELIEIDEALFDKVDEMSISQIKQKK